VHKGNGRPDLLKEGLNFVCEGEFCYQRWILADGIEVGEGQNFVDVYRDASSRYDNNIYRRRRISTICWAARRGS
jgi:hypothetical protein